MGLNAGRGYCTRVGDCGAVTFTVSGAGAGRCALLSAASAAAADAAATACVSDDDHRPLRPPPLTSVGAKMGPLGA
eukprot:gene33693-63567_t